MGSDSPVWRGHTGGTRRVVIGDRGRGVGYVFYDADPVDVQDLEQRREVEWLGEVATEQNLDGGYPDERNTRSWLWRLADDEYRHYVTRSRSDDEAWAAYRAGAWHGPYPTRQEAVDALQQAYEARVPAQRRESGRGSRPRGNPRRQ